MYCIVLSAMLALLLPLLLGFVWLRALLGPPHRGCMALLCGYGMFLGLIATTLIMQLLDGAGFELTRFNIVIALCLAILLGAGLGLARRSARPVLLPIRSPHITLGWQTLTNLQKLLVSVLVALIAYRFLLLTIEVSLRPLFPWDASMHWATKAKVWFNAGQLAPFVTPERWLEVEGAGVFTDRHPDYPKAVSLLQVWVSILLGQWNESLVNIPWLGCFVALGVMFYAQARWAGASIVLASAFTYMLLSMPLLNTHVALGGYADLFLGSCYAAAVMAFYNWSTTRTRGQGLLAAFSAVACCLIKNEGLFWLFSFAPGVLLACFPVRRAAAAILALALAAMLAVLLLPTNQVVAGHSLASLGLTFHPEAIPALAASFFSKGSWHLFAYLLPFTLLGSLFVERQAWRRYLPMLAVLGTAFLLFLVLFAFTDFYKATIRFTAVSRISLQLVPAFMFLTMLLFRDLWQSDTPSIAEEPKTE